MKNNFFDYFSTVLIVAVHYNCLLTWNKNVNAFYIHESSKSAIVVV